MNEDLIKRLRFHGRFGFESSEIQKLRKYNEREEAADCIVELEKRLEIDPCHSYDGIACRDETIKVQDQRIYELEQQMNNLFDDVERKQLALTDCEAALAKAQESPSEPVYQASQPFTQDPANTWRDPSRDAYELCLPHKRRILYTNPTPASAQAVACDGLLFATEWLRNNYQDYSTVASLCDALLEARPTSKAGDGQ